MLKLWKWCWMMSLLTEVLCQVFLNEWGQYENIVVRIEPDVNQFKESVLLNTLKQFSQSMHLKTEMMVSVKNVIVILPEDYDSTQIQGEIHPLKDESIPNSASILIVGKNNTLREELPYTLHLGGCGHQGEFIVFGEDHLTHKIIGNRGMMLLHEWVHYRWGVFDEYGIQGNKVSPFYLNDQKHIVVTGCPSNLSGWLLKKTGATFSKCQLTKEGLPDYACRFYLPHNRTGSSSIMMGYDHLNDKFCNNDNSSELVHNSVAPNLQNLKCNGQSAWEVIRRHPDFSERKKPAFTSNIGIKYMKRMPEHLPKLKIIIKRNGLKNDSLLKIDAVIGWIKGIGNEFSLQIDVANVDDENLLSQEFNTPESRYFLLTSSWEEICNKTHTECIILNRTWTQSIDSQAKKPLSVLSPDLPFSELLLTLGQNLLEKFVGKDKMPFVIHKKKSNNKIASGEYYIDYSCTKADIITYCCESGNFEKDFFRTSHVNPNIDGQLFQWNNVEDLSMSITIFALNKWTDGRWTYNVTRKPKVPETDIGTLTFLVVCLQREGSESISLIPHVFTERTDNIFNGSNSDMVKLGLAVRHNGNPVIQANASIVVTSDSGKEIHHSLYDDGLEPDTLENDGVYSGSFFDFGGNGFFSISFEVHTSTVSKSMVHFVELGSKNTPESNDETLHEGTSMPYPAILTHDEDRIVSEKFGKPKSDFTFDDFGKLSDEANAKSKLTEVPLPNTDAYSQPFPIKVIDYTPDDIHPPGKVTDLTVVMTSTLRSTVTLELTSPGDDGFYGKADSMILRYSKTRSFYPFKFDKEGIWVKEEDLRNNSSLKPKMAREKHRIVVEMPKEPDSDYLDNVAFFFAVIFKDEKDNHGDISNLAFAYFKPKKYSEELQELMKKSMSGIIAGLVFLSFVIVLGLSLVMIKFCHKNMKTLNINQQATS